MRSETMLFARDVEATSRWYQDFLGVASGHGGDEFEMLMDGDKLLLQLHKLDPGFHDHGVATEAPLGNGVVVFLHVDDPDAVYAHAKESGIEVVEDIYDNPEANMRQFTVRDPNGYSLAICKSAWG